MELYLLKSAAILAVLFAFYKVVLENTSMHTFKRFYLFGSLLAAFLIPLITFTSYVEVSSIVPIYSEVTPQLNYPEVEQTLNYWPFVLWTIYGLGVLFFSIKFFRNLFGLIQQIRKNPKYKNTPFINVLLSETVIPHTFFNYIFLNKKQFENREIPQEVIFHEETHARQKHSLDIIFVELLQIVFWFNPLFHFIKKSIKLNHEFLADRAVLNAGAKTSDYQKILLAFSSNAATPSLAHSLNYSSIKKRFTLMKTRTSKRAVWIKSLLILPLISVLIYGFSTKEVLAKHFEKNSVFTSDIIEDIKIVIDKNSQLTLNGIPVKLEDLKIEINKRNKHLSSEQKQKYLSANVGLYNESDNDLSEKIIEILYASNFRNFSISNLKNMADADLDTAPLANPMAGKTVEEAEILYQERLKDIEKFKTANSKLKNDENNPWSIDVGEDVERSEITGKIIQQNSTIEFNGTINQKKATKAEIEEYNKLAKKYNAVDIEERIIKKKDLERLEIIYKKMTLAQRAKAQPFPECNQKQNYSREEDNKKFSEANYYYKGERITFEKANELLDKNNNIGIYISKEENTVHLYEEPFDKKKIAIKDNQRMPSAENGNLYMAPEAPPAPIADPVEYVKELGKRGATFYIGPHNYSTDEAIEMVKKSTNDVTIDVSQYPIVHLGGC